MRIITKSPEATFDYRVCWPRAALLGVPIAESAWESVPRGLSITPLEATRRQTGARIGGGRPGRRYCLVHRVTLADDRTLTRALTIEAAR